MAMVFYLIYTSTPRSPISREVLEEITAVSNRNNRRRGITGMLLGIENKFLQYLEGDEEEVMTLFEKIKSDPRHKDITVWIKGYGSDMVFQDWSMGSWLLTNEELERLSALEDLKSFLQDPVNEELQSKKFIGMMNSLLKTWIAHEPERVKKMRQ